MRVIDADKLIAQWEEDAKHMDDVTCQMMTYGAINDVKKQPAIDIVRCKECEHWHENDFVDGLSYGECDNGVIKKSVWTNEAWFCKDGERRADDGNS